MSIAMLPLIMLVFASGPPPGHAWEPIPEFTDEFDGDTLDADKWHDHDPNWKGRQPAFFSPDNVSVQDGRLRLDARAETLPNLPEGYHSFTTAAVKSKTTVLYGYFEIKCKVMRAAVCNAFWFYNATPEMWTEIDVFEVGGGVKGRERHYHTNAHVFHTPDYKGTVEDHLVFGDIWEAPDDLADAFYVCALEWDAKEIKWYVNGVLIRTLDNKHWHQPLYMMFDVETMPEWFGLPDPAELPASFQIQYIRSWRRADE